MDCEFTTSMVPPSNPGSSLGSSTPNRVLTMTHDNFPPVTQSTSTNKRQQPDSADEQTTSTDFKTSDNFTNFLVIKSEDETLITNLSPFVIEKQIEAIIGTPKFAKN